MKNASFGFFDLLCLYALLYILFHYSAVIAFLDRVVQ